MNRNLKFAVLSLGVLGMGMAMPSCPGQQAMQQQIETLQTTTTDLNKKVQTLTTQIKEIQKDMDQAKQLLPQMTNVIQAQKGALDQLEATVRDMRTKGGGKKKK